MQLHMEPFQEPFKHLAKIEKQMPAVGDLCCPWHAGCSAPSILGRAVAGHNLNPRMGLQPQFKGFCITVRQHINWTALLEIHQHGAIALPAPQCKIVDAYDAWCVNINGSLLNQAHKGVGARW